MGTDELRNRPQRLFAACAPDGLGKRTKCFVRVFFHAFHRPVRIERFLGSYRQSDFFTAICVYFKSGTV